MLIPPGFGTVTPYLFVEDADRLLQFLKEAFDSVEVGCTRRPDGKIANAQIRLGTTTLMLSESSPRYPARPGSFYLYVENADHSTARAIDAGASLEMKVADMPYGDRQGGVVDPVGNIWWISQRLEDKAYY